MAAPLTLLDPTPADDDFFGSAVTFAGGQLLVGARFDDTAADNAGAAAGGIVVVGAPFDDTTKPNAGSAYVFDAATGALRHTLQAPHPREGDLFGSAVAASDTTIVVGAPFDDTVAANAGAVHLFDAATGALLHTLLNPASDVDSRFGSAVAIAGGTVLVGAPFDDTDAADAGIAYLFDVASGTLLTTFENPTPSPGDQFGASLAMAGNVVAIGSWLDDTAAPGGGAVYVFGNDASPPGSTTTTTLPPTTTTVTTTSSTVSTTATSTTSTATTTSATTSSSAPAGTTTTTTSTATTLAPPVVACATVCDDHDPCTLDACADAGCIHTPEIGFDAVVCRLDTLDTVLHGLPHLAPGGRRTALALQRQVARARRLVDAARTGRRSARKLLRAERALARFAVTVRRAMLSGRIARVAAGNVLALAADA